MQYNVVKYVYPLASREPGMLGCVFTTIDSYYKYAEEADRLDRKSVV